jgi:hypothetical protein
MNKKAGKRIYSLIPLEDFKALMGVDSREDKTAIFCIVTSTLTIEKYCMRQFLQKKKTEILYLKDLFVRLREYPVSEILAVYGINTQKEMLIKPQFYRPMIGNDFNEEMPFELFLSYSLKPYRFTAVKIIYWSGYRIGFVPADLAAACMELAAWNMNRYRGRRIGMTGNVRKDGEYFEMSMPSNVRGLLEPYKRKVI